MKRLILMGVLIAAIGLAGWFWFFKAKPEPTFIKEEATNQIQKHLERRHQQKYYSQLVAIYKKILTTEPANEGAKKELAKAYYELSRLTFEEEDLTTAKENITKALALDPQNAKALELSQKLEQR